MARVFAAVDLGASGGRVIAGVVDRDSVSLHPMHRFDNGAEMVDGHLRWSLTGLYREVLDGLARLAAKYPQVESIGIDTWGVDYGLLGGDGDLLAEPIAYRDDRTRSVIQEVHERISPDELFAINGLQYLPFNTIYQLAAERQSPWWEKAAHVVLLPDLIAYWLTGELRTEATNASTTGLLDVHTGGWSTPLLGRLDIPLDVLPPIEEPGAIRGNVRRDLCRELGMSSSTVVTTVGSHDTASAVVGVPATTRRSAFVASGTWSLVGLELDAPILSADVRAANFTNERGIDGRTRFLHNTGGLWLLQESQRCWREQGSNVPLTALLAAAAEVPSGPVVDVDDPIFLPPGDMPRLIGEAAFRAGYRAPTDPRETVRCIIDSLATAYAGAVERTAQLAGAQVDVVHIVGGGAQNDLLCQCTAGLAQRPVIAGPVEATAMGNVLVQARAHDAAPASLEEMRAQAASTCRLRRFDPLEPDRRAP